jgi:hypothetical protein
MSTGMGCFFFLKKLLPALRRVWDVCGGVSGASKRPSKRAALPTKHTAAGRPAAGLVGMHAPCLPACTIPAHDTDTHTHQRAHSPLPARALPPSHTHMHTHTHR